ncbi:PrpR N-terminal domain-containing protein [Bacillus sp. ISL-47]|uniref:sigma-54-dependent Fis family transcriptional regulator n=1 Tax=Bacillus sp. ISL-47 TaxID=2819130 RepID=UPI001BE63AD2|nr:sigma-54-dependent Fis family transcriptional regulator [Bacillus sp. ISL-47]MBT2686652.1 PrpR N-terminal domain-containing protein [Bacillus sp. ISL-47]MBT2707044.1 PrpR N-terminal domain-containing protein [Pseudomonas sp. ISL-84]
MKIKTLFIAPYPAMIPLIEECRGKEDDLDIKIEIGNLRDALPYVKNAETDGTEMIISRGGTAKLIEQETNIPVIDVQLSGYDMLRVLTLANDFPGKKAIVGFSNITLGAKTITDILEIGIEVFTVAKEEEVESLVFDLKSKGFELIMGDVVTVEAAAKFGLEGILIQSGREAIFDAFYKVESVYHSFRKKQMENELLKTLLKVNTENILVTDSQGEKVFEQWNTFSSPPIQISQLGALVHRRESPDSVVTMKGTNGEDLKIRVCHLKIGEDSFTQFLISELESEKQASSNLKIEAVPQLPMIIQESEAMKDCLASVSAGSSRNFWVLIGSAGTGKGLIARYIHYLRYQGNGLFASIHAEENVKMPVAFDEDTRTIFIDGAEEISLKERAELLKQCKQWTQEGKDVILSLYGETEDFHAIIFDDEVNRVYIPSLTERKEDIRPMTAYFIAGFHQQLGTSAIKIKEEAFELLEQYHWPGNAAELKTFLYDVVKAEKEYTIRKDSVAKQLERKQQRPAQFEEGLLSGTLDQIEKRIIEAVMEEENQNQTKVSKRLGINRSTLWRKLKQ